MFNLEKCREVLKSADYTFEAEEIVALRDFLYKFATYQVEYEMGCEAENNEIQNLVA